MRWKEIVFGASRWKPGPPAAAGDGPPPRPRAPIAHLMYTRLINSVPGRRLKALKLIQHSRSQPELIARSLDHRFPMSVHRDFILFDLFYEKLIHQLDFFFLPSALLLDYSRSSPAKRKVKKKTQETLGKNQRPQAFFLSFILSTPFFDGFEKMPQSEKKSDRLKACFLL